MIRTMLSVTAVAIVLGAGVAQADDEVIVPSHHVEVGPVSTDTPSVTSHEHEGTFWDGVQDCLANPQTGPDVIGCPP